MAFESKIRTCAWWAETRWQVAILYQCLLPHDSHRLPILGRYISRVEQQKVRHSIETPKCPYCSDYVLVDRRGGDLNVGFSVRSQALRLLRQSAWRNFVADSPLDYAYASWYPCMHHSTTLYVIYQVVKAVIYIHYCILHHLLYRCSCHEAEIMY